MCMHVQYSSQWELLPSTYQLFPQPARGGPANLSNSTQGCDINPFGELSQRTDWRKGGSTSGMTTYFNKI